MREQIFILSKRDFSMEETIINLKRSNHWILLNLEYNYKLADH